MSTMKTNRKSTELSTCWLTAFYDIKVVDSITVLDKGYSLYYCYCYRVWVHEYKTSHVALHIIVNIILCIGCQFIVVAVHITIIIIIEHAALLWKWEIIFLFPSCFVMIIKLLILTPGEHHNFQCLLRWTIVSMDGHVCLTLYKNLNLLHGGNL